MDNGVGFSYHDDPDQTESAFKGKRFSLGDIGYLDSDGYLFISDRAKDMIITGGTNVYPAEIEATLLEHPKVHDAGVIGIPDPDWGETITALVQLKPGYEPTDEVRAELMSFCKERLASYKVPRRWEFRDDLPRTEAGKLYKRKSETSTWPRWRADDDRNFQDEHPTRGIQGRRRAREGVPESARTRADRRRHRQGTAAARDRRRVETARAQLDRHRGRAPQLGARRRRRQPVVHGSRLRPGHTMGNPDRPRHPDRPHQDTDVGRPDSRRDQGADEGDVPGRARVRVGRHVGVVPAVAARRSHLQLPWRGLARYQAVRVRRPLGDPDQSRRGDQPVRRGARRLPHPACAHRAQAVTIEGQVRGDRAGPLHRRRLRAHRRRSTPRRVHGGRRSATGRT